MRLDRKDPPRKPSSVRRTAEEHEALEEQAAPETEQNDEERRVGSSASENDDAEPAASENADAGNAGDAKEWTHLADDERKEAEAEAAALQPVVEEAEAEGFYEAADARRGHHGPRGTGNGIWSETARTPRPNASYIASGNSDDCRHHESVEKAYR